MGNVGSISNMLTELGIESQVSSDIQKILASDKIILPGVGSFDVGMKNLKSRGLVDIIKEFVVAQKKPILGICLGMQMLGESSEEGIEEGLGLLPFICKKFIFSKDDGLKVPHMGWNYVTPPKDFTDEMLHKLDNNPKFYFVHSYYAQPIINEIILLETSYGIKFTAAVKRNNIVGVQFHPEKSHMYGMQLLENFSRL